MLLNKTIRLDKVKIFLLLLATFLSGFACSPDLMKEEPVPASKETTTNADSADTNCKKLAEFSDESGDVFDCSAQPGKKVRLRIHVPENLQPNIVAFFDVGEKKECVGLTRKVHKLADKYELNKWGFNFSGERLGKYFEMSSDYIASDNPPKSVAYDMSSSSKPSPFQPYVEQLEKYKKPNKYALPVKSNQHAVSFFSRSKARLVIPKKNHLTLY
ncbi:MAG: hypothetical protein ACREGC_02620, partial [Minisyncoccia bacterium]